MTSQARSSQACSVVTEAASAALASVSAGTTALRANELSVETRQAGARTIVVVIGRIATEVGLDPGGFRFSEC